MVCSVEVLEELAEELMRGGNEARFRVRGASMHPTIFDGDAVRIRSCSVENVKTGDVVLFRRGGILCLHRVIYRTKGVTGETQGFVTAGDGLPEPDGVARPRDLIGTVVAAQRGERWIETSSFGSRWWALLRVLASRHPGARRVLRAARGAASRMLHRHGGVRTRTQEVSRCG